MDATVRIEGLKDFRKALKAADDASPRELTKALKKAGVPLYEEIKRNVPVRTGRLKGSIRKPVASGTKGRIHITEPYAGIIEFAQTPKKRPRLGPTLTSRYGLPPRYAFRALLDIEVQNEIAEIALDELKEIVTIHGWAK